MTQIYIVSFDNVHIIEYFHMIISIDECEFLVFDTKFFWLSFFTFEGQLCKLTKVLYNFITIKNIFEIPIHKVANYEACPTKS